MEHEIIITEENRGEIAEKVYQGIINIIQDLNRNFLELGQSLYVVAEYELWEGRADTFEEFLEMPEIGLHKSQAFALMRIYKTFVLEFGIPEKQLALVGSTKCTALLEGKKEIDSDNVEELLNDAQHMTVNDVKIAVGSTPEEYLRFRGFLIKDEAGYSMAIDKAIDELEGG